MTKEETALIKQVLKNQDDFKQSHNDLYIKVTRIEAIVTGVNGGGLLQKLNEVSESHYNFKSRVTLLIGILIGLGLLGGGGYGLVQLFG